MTAIAHQQYCQSSSLLLLQSASASVPCVSGAWPRPPEARAHDRPHCTHRSSHGWAIPVDEFLDRQTSLPGPLIRRTYPCTVQYVHKQPSFATASTWQLGRSRPAEFSKPRNLALSLLVRSSACDMIGPGVSGASPR
ncbi:hypothetical protein EDB81DRAFT_398481 [Dactylonectria macrodidyma]|uniref:Uncharacterized protein n=1 Tax=Dactylonectria macrodidyma TaxID=307937 RepID=A0A9P9JG19_9HYPO|nr:hypothetical protein EDB81DRAFT_398481 [Dactylonectria macrodidyma]